MFGEVKVKYEYKILKYAASAFSLGRDPSSSDEVEMHKNFNALGKKGWDLVGVVAINKASGTTERCIYTFKRQVREESS